MDIYFIKRYLNSIATLDDYQNSFRDLNVKTLVRPRGFRIDIPPGTQIYAQIIYEI